MQKKTFHHPHVGTIILSFQCMQLETTRQRLGVYTAEPGTPDHDAMVLLDRTVPAAPDTHCTTPAALTPRPQHTGPAGVPEPKQQLAARACSAPTARRRRTDQIVFSR